MAISLDDMGFWQAHGQKRAELRNFALILLKITQKFSAETIQIVKLPLIKHFLHNFFSFDKVHKQCGPKSN